MTNDYRYTPYCDKQGDVREKKKDVENRVKAEHPKSTNMYKYISDNKKPFKNNFANAYNDRCSYCGLTRNLLSLESFEIDHWVCKKHRQFQGVACKNNNVNSIDNLCLSCPDCNRKKSDFDVKRLPFNLDGEGDKAIENYFERDNSFKICIKKEHLSNQELEEFYNEMDFGNLVHRIDYLLVSIDGLKQRLTEKIDVYNRLGNIYAELSKKRNWS